MFQYLEFAGTAKSQGLLQQIKQVIDVDNMLHVEELISICIYNMTAYIFMH